MTSPEGEPQSSARRASTLTALGSVGLVALAIAGALSLWVRASGAVVDRPPDTGVEEPLPAALPDGTPFAPVPPAIAAAVGEDPVVGAARLETLPEGFTGCGMEPGFEQTADLRSAVMTPDGLLIELVGPAPDMFGPRPVPVEVLPAPGGPELAPPPPNSGPTQQPMPPQKSMPDPGPPTLAEDDPLEMTGEAPLALATCTAEWRDGRWSGNGGSFGPLDAGGSSGGASCCDADGLGTANGRVPVPTGAAWALQERGTWWLALPVEDATQLSLTWKFRDGPFGRGGGSTHLIWVGAEGSVIDETYASF